jgi:hypothetical protein
MNTSRIFTLSLFLIAGMIISACSTNDTGMGTLKVSLTDAPALYDEVNIEITQVLVKNSEGEEPEGDNEEDGWYAIMNDSITVNLLDYQNGAVLDLGETELEVGRYNQIRLILGDNNTVVIDGETYALTTPSAQQSGYKLNVNADIEEGQTYDLVIDFDASQSIVVTGNGKYNLKPVLRTVDLENQGSLSGTVLPLEAAPYVYAIMDQDTMSTQPDEEGNFRIVGLEEGSYNVWIEPTNESYADSLIQNIEIEEGEDFEFEETIELKASSSSPLN